MHRVFRSKECSEDPFYGLNRVGMERANEYISMLRENPSFSHQAKITCIRRQIPLYDMPASAGSGVFLDSDSYTLIDVDENVPEAATLAVRISGGFNGRRCLTTDKLFTCIISRNLKTVK